jgi:hypothetical protein
MNTIDMIVSRLKDAQVKEIESKRCFIVNRETFLMIGDDLRRAGIPLEYDPRFGRTHKFETIEFSASSADEPRYLICTPVEKILDILWDRKVKS